MLNRGNPADVSWIFARPSATDCYPSRRAASRWTFLPHHAPLLLETTPPRRHVRASAKLRRATTSSRSWKTFAHARSPMILSRQPSPRFFLPFSLAAVVVAATVPAPLFAQKTPEPKRSLDLTISGTGISIGDSRRVRGIRLNYRDSRLERVDGLNATLWYPYEDGEGDVNGIALGLPLTGGRHIRGIALGVGVGATEKLSGIGAALIGLGGGADVEGIFVAGVGTGSGRNVTGLSIGGLGVGAGGDLRGIMIGGLGAGAGGNVKGLLVGGLGGGTGGNLQGIAIGGLGVGAGGRLDGVMIGGLGAGGGSGGRGLLIGGVGAGVGGDYQGIAVGGVGVGAGGDFTGLAVGGAGVGVGGDGKGIFFGGLGVGSGGSLRYLAIGGLGVGAPSITGLAVGGLGVGGQHLNGVMVGGYTVKVIEGGTLRGVGVSAFNDIRGTQRGLTIGLVNHAWRLHGMQIGIINIVKNNPSGRRVLPLVNWNFDK